jgi:BirA family biotin operon repressor/biotin-[acetyl-CoA-carboxylase] ligase
MSARGLDVEAVRARFPGRVIQWFDSVPSTMPLTAKLAAEGAAHGTVVGAEEQTAGQGRLGRSWHSEAGRGLYVSIVLRSAQAAGAFPGLTLAVGLATQEAILRSCGVHCDLRWPNDILIGEKKCAGILLNREGAAAIAGIGINVNHKSFPPEIAPLATSLRLAAGHEFSREKLLVELLDSVEAYCEMIDRDGIEPILRLFTQMSTYASGRRVVVETPSGVVEGITEGLDPQGFLRVRTDNGRVERIMAGGVRPAVFR